MPRTHPCLRTLALTAAAGIMAFQPLFAGSNTDFFKAVREEDGNTVETLIGTPGNNFLNLLDSDSGKGALHIVTQGKKLTWLRYLLGKGANPNLLDKDGEAALHIAAQLNFVEGAKALIAGDATVDIRNRGGETPLIRAVRLRHREMIVLLLASGADPALTDNITGRSARDYATEDPRGRDIVTLLDARDTEKSTTDTNGGSKLDFSGGLLTP